MYNVISATMLAVAAMTVAAGGPQVKNFPKAPDGCRPAYSADTLKALIDKARPTLLTNHDAPIFVWIQPHRDQPGCFVFTVAQAFRTHQKAGPWMILDDPEGRCGSNFAVLPRTKISLAVDSVSTLTPFSHVATPATPETHKVHGALYQVAIHRREGCLQGEERLFLLHQPKNGWRFVGYGPGPGGDDGGWNEVTQTVAWTNDPKAPVRIVFTTGYSPRQAEGERACLRQYTQAVLEGPIPAKPKEVAGPYLLVSPGDTFLGLMARLYKEHADERAPAAERSRRLNTLIAEVRGLNPGLNVSRLRVGDHINIPTWERLLELCRM